MCVGKKKIGSKSKRRQSGQHIWQPSLSPSKNFIKFAEKEPFHTGAVTNRGPPFPSPEHLQLSHQEPISFHRKGVLSGASTVASETGTFLHNYRQGRSKKQLTF